MRRGQLWRHTYKYSYLQVLRARGDVFYFCILPSVFRFFAFSLSRSPRPRAPASPLVVRTLLVERALLPFKRDAPNLCFSDAAFRDCAKHIDEHFFRDFSEFALSCRVEYRLFDAPRFVRFDEFYSRQSFSRRWV